MTYKSASTVSTVPKELPPVQERLRSVVDLHLANMASRDEDNAWEYGLTYRVSREGMLDLFRELKGGEPFLMNFLVDITAVDWLDRRESRFDVVYQLMSLTYGSRLSIKVAVPEEDPKLASLVELWPAANFLEREVWDMFGIVFEGHGDLRRILMYDEFQGHPLRKDYPILRKQPRVPLRMPELHNTGKDMRREPLVSLPVRQGRAPVASKG